MFISRLTLLFAVVKASFSLATPIHLPDHPAALVAEKAVLQFDNYVLECTETRNPSLRATLSFTLQDHKIVEANFQYDEGALFVRDFGLYGPYVDRNDQIVNVTVFKNLRDFRFRFEMENQVPFADLNDTLNSYQYKVYVWPLDAGGNSQGIYAYSCEPRLR